MRRLRRPLLLTHLGMVSERALRAFWPLLSVLLIASAALMLGLHDLLAIEAVWSIAVLLVTGALGGLVWGASRFRWPRRIDVLARLDASLPGRPIQALMDSQAIGGQDAASVAVWHAHQQRMAARAAQARAPHPDLRLATRDPFALRYVAVLAFVVALVFGSVMRVGSVAQMTPDGGARADAASWEGWVEPPRYTGLPTLYLNDFEAGAITAPEGSRITLRFYGTLGALTLSETVSGREKEVPSAADQVQDFRVAHSGELEIVGDGGRAWTLDVTEDAAPVVSVEGEIEAAALGQISVHFSGKDDYGVESGRALIALDLAAVDRRYGLAVAPDARPPLDVPLPMPIAGDRSEFSETLVEDFSQHPFANLPVTITLKVSDALDQVGTSGEMQVVLPGRRFFDPLAAAIIEQRRDLLWSRSNALRVAQILRAVSHRPDDIFRLQTAYLRLRVTLRRLEILGERGLGPDHQQEIAQALWDLAVILEDGDLGDAMERLRRAQERLSEAMRNGASEQEIAELMQELREASNDYVRQLAQQAQRNAEENQNGDSASSDPGERMQMSQNDLEQMMDRIQELMEQGRMAEAQEALEQLQELMENMRVAEAQQGEGGQSEGQRAMEGLADTLREQQGLSDQAFRDLQEQFNPDAQAGERQGNRGRDGGQGEGQQHSQGGQGQGAEQGGQPGESQQQGQQGQGSDPAQSLADRQEALRRELQRQQGNLPGQTAPGGQDARDALDRAGEAMDGAEEALRGDDLASAIDRQSEAMEALREGMRALGEALAQEEQQQQPGQGQQPGDMRAQNRDPLGRRNPGSEGSIGTDEGMLQGADVYRRARDLLDEIRRRSGEGARPEIELDYLRRLLERF